MPDEGFIEILSTDFVTGWAKINPGGPTVLYAVLDDKIIGFAKADLKRRDLEIVTAEGSLSAAGFLILFQNPIPHDRVQDVEVFSLKSASRLHRTAKARIDGIQKTQIFILGSPRSGTSELGNTLAGQLKLPWMGEGHAGPLFAAAAHALSGNIGSENDVVRFMAEQNVKACALEAAKRTFFYMHGSASFIDKTPGVPMILAAPFLIECFPQAKIIYLRRNGISNVLSRMAKFGGDFDEHCTDWAAALEEWTNVKSILPHYLELTQEDMAANPEFVGTELGKYLQIPHMVEAFAQSLRSGSLEKTGAGRGRDQLSQTGWSDFQKNRFRILCGPTMEKFGYPLDAPPEFDFFAEE